ncbi:2Fe-2S iron-sulfur cluster binding domain protein [Phialemonium atrogriseum]|uniref:2Fe-2S iron-sulfur cluster binding domain protein n=1 Tax=Phialemonium atrogriseum TaxID=1093897 RepID=A0AAJ0FMN9_9PEZI|nr:2Fe-2S iron-sulfur cluster binding domain protein [Phialemonium atrogriseum]KAK1766335.1 2Fe-2S iron-sulfur cluster binding domain protein [Phialemonium atrogriseum]
MATPARTLCQAFLRAGSVARRRTNGIPQQVRCLSRQSYRPSTPPAFRQCTSPSQQCAALLRRPQFRAISTSRALLHGHIDPPKPGEELYVTFIDKEGDEHKFAVSEGDNLLDIAQANDLEMEGACGGSCACSTCHVIVSDQDYYDKLPEPDDDENDMLDLAFGLTETSRLGCQVIMKKELDGLKVKLPSMTRNLQASDFQ